MIGKIILGIFVGLEILLTIKKWGKPQVNVGLVSLLAFFLDVGIIGLGVVYW
jgi:hypothetical protein